MPRTIRSRVEYRTSTSLRQHFTTTFAQSSTSPTQETPVQPPVLLHFGPQTDCSQTSKVPFQEGPVIMKTHLPGIPQQSRSSGARFRPWSFLRIVKTNPRIHLRSSILEQHVAVQSPSSSTIRSLFFSRLTIFQVVPLHIRAQLTVFDLLASVISSSGSREDLFWMTPSKALGPQCFWIPLDC